MPTSSKPRTPFTARLACNFDDNGTGRHHHLGWSRNGRWYVDQIPARLASISDVATDEFASHLVGGMHDDERAGAWIDDEVAGLGDSADQPADQLDRLDMRVNLVVRPSPASGPRSAMIAPRRFSFDWRFLVEQIVSASADAVAHAELRTFPGDQTNSLEFAAEKR